MRRYAASYSLALRYDAEADATCYAQNCFGVQRGASPPPRVKRCYSSRCAMKIAQSMAPMRRKMPLSLSFDYFCLFYVLPWLVIHVSLSHATLVVFARAMLRSATA